MSNDSAARAIVGPGHIERAPTKTTRVTEHYQAKAATLVEQIVIRHAVPIEMLEQLQEALYREAIEEARLATSSLPIGTFALERVATTLANLKRKKVG